MLYLKFVLISVSVNSTLVKQCFLARANNTNKCSLCTGNLIKTVQGLASGKVVGPAHRILLFASKST